MPPHKHGLKLARSFEANSWLKAAADRIPEEMLVTTEAWELILQEILQSLKPYLDVKVDVLLEETLYAVVKDNRETMAQYVTKKTNKRREMCQALGMEYYTRNKCHGQIAVQKDLPDEVWTYILR